MKTGLIIPLALSIFGVCFSTANPVRAQTFTVLHCFNGDTNGGNPKGKLILSGNTLYGTADRGFGSLGTVFKLNFDGTGFTTLHNFNGHDGESPVAGLILTGETLYGMTPSGQTFDDPGPGTLFSVKTDGSDFTNLFYFNRKVGAAPEGELALFGNILYGTTSSGGASIAGTVFACNLDGTGLTNLVNFSGLNGGYPAAGVIVSSNVLYGTTVSGIFETLYGSIFEVNFDGTGFRTLHGFQDGSDGKSPHAGLTLSDNILYGTTYNGGSLGGGTVFKINIDGTGFQTLHNFSDRSGGQQLQSGLTLVGDRLYGTTYLGGSLYKGTVFKINTDGTGFETVHEFTGGDDGASPCGGVICAGNSLYGTALWGTSLHGLVFRLSFTPQLTISLGPTNVVLAWPTNSAGFDFAGYNLECATNLGPQEVWSRCLPLPVVVNGYSTVTNALSAAQCFFRLKQ